MHGAQHPAGDARTRSKEVTIILHEHNTLTGEARAHIDARKKRYVRLLEASFAEAMREGRIRPVNPKVAAFAFLGMVLWTYKWFRADGAISRETLSREMVTLFFGGLAAAPRRRDGRGAQARPRSSGATKAQAPDALKRRRQRRGLGGQEHEERRLEEELEAHVLAALEQHADREHVADGQRQGEPDA